MAETNEIQLDRRILRHLLQPSYLSATVAVIVTVLALGSEVISRLYLSTGWLADALRTVANSDQHLLGSSPSDGSSPFNVVLLFLFWACVGLTVYFVVIGVAQAAREVRELEQEMNYVHTNRRAILRNFAERLITRFAGLVLAFVTAAIFLKIILPYALTAVETATLAAGSVIAVVVAIITLLVTLHLLAVLLRLVALRPRLFTAEIES